LLTLACEAWIGPSTSSDRLVLIRERLRATSMIFSNQNL